MNCHKIRNRLSTLMDMELDGETSLLLERHLRGCSECREYFHELGRVDALVQGLPKIDLSRDFARRVVNEIRASVDARQASTAFPARLKQAVLLFSEVLFGLFAPESGKNPPVLDEFSDYPPLSLGFIYFKLLEHPKRG